MRPPVSDRARAYLQKLEAPIRAKDHPQDSHSVMFQAASILVHGFLLDYAQSTQLLTEFASRSDAPWSSAEIHHKVTSAKATPSTKGDGYLLGDSSSGGNFNASDAPLPPMEPPPKAPDFDADELARMAKPWNESVGSVWLANRSAVDPCELDAAGFLKVLYPEGEKVLAFTNQMSQGQALWPKDALPRGGRDGVWFLPQPVDGEYHPNPRSVDKQGNPKSSRRSMESVTAWRYMLLESDEADMRDWLGLLVQMPLRVAAIYSSGGRSVHVLIQVDRSTKESWDALKEELKPALNLLCVAGVDMKAITAVRLSRLPQCLRGRKRQKLFYVNPEPRPRPICELPMLRNVEDVWCGYAEQGIADSDETGGKWLFDALGYYAPGSARCREALEKLREELESE